MIDSANKLSGCFFGEGGVAEVHLGGVKPQGPSRKESESKAQRYQKYCHLKEINDNLKVLNTLYN